MAGNGAREAKILKIRCLGPKRRRFGPSGS